MGTVTLYWGDAIDEAARLDRIQMFVLRTLV
jgi:hypothetical protein